MKIIKRKLFASVSLFDFNPTFDSLIHLELSSYFIMLYLPKSTIKLKFPIAWSVQAFWHYSIAWEYASIVTGNFFTQNICKLNSTDPFYVDYPFEVRFISIWWTGTNDTFNIRMCGRKTSLFLNMKNTRRGSV